MAQTKLRWVWRPSWFSSEHGLIADIIASGLNAIVKKLLLEHFIGVDGVSRFCCSTAELQNLHPPAAWPTTFVNYDAKVPRLPLEKEQNIRFGNANLRLFSLTTCFSDKLLAFASTVPLAGVGGSSNVKPGQRNYPINDYDQRSRQRAWMN